MLKYEGKAVNDIKKADIHNAFLKNEDKIYVQNNKTKMVAGLSKKSLNKIISTIFTLDIESRYIFRTFFDCNIKTSFDNCI